MSEFCDIPGPTITISITPDGEYHNASGGGNINFHCDGKGFAVGTLGARASGTRSEANWKSRTHLVLVAAQEQDADGL